MRWSEINEAPERQLLLKEIVLKDGTPATVVVTQDSNGKPSSSVYVDGQYAGGASFGENSFYDMPGTWSATSNWTNVPFRRKGVAMAAYDAMEELGYKLVPEPRYHKRSADADAFWAARKRRQAD